MSSYVTLGSQTPIRAVDVVLSIIRMQAPSESASNAKGLCAFETLTAVGKVGLEFGLQLAVGAVMVALVALVALSAWLRLRFKLIQVCRRKLSQTSAFDASSGVGSIRTRLLDARASDTVGRDAPHDIGSSREHSLNLGQQLADSVSPGPSVTVGNGAGPPARVRYIIAAVNFVVTAYSTVTVATFKMLHCVRVPGSPVDQRRLFIQGSVVCDYMGWQVVYVVGIAVLVAVPAILLLVASWAVRRSEAAPSEREGAVVLA
jgi:hypothetical protein